MDNPMLFAALREFTSGLLNQLLVNLAGENGLMWLDEFKAFMRREPCWVAAPRKDSSMIDLYPFFQNRQGLQVGRHFHSLVLARFNLGLGVTHFDLDRRLTDRDIQSSANTFEEERVSRVVASLIDTQSKGEEGVLLTDGRMNIFFTRTSVVSLNWVAARKNWRVDAWALGDNIWDTNCRVFSRKAHSH